MIYSWKFVLSLILSHSVCAYALGQETNSQFSAKIITADRVPLAAVKVTLSHEPTQSVTQTISRSDGYFHFFNLKPGGPYTLSIKTTGYESVTQSNLFFNLISEKMQGDTDLVFILDKQIVILPTLTVEAKRVSQNTTGLTTNIDERDIRLLPSISRNFHDYVRLVPQAVITRDGGISLGGQNNRTNAFYIDGANNNDILGLAASGTNGGQSGSPPISMEAIEQVTVGVAPYDVQYTGFTGGTINAITRSGTNQVKVAAWYYFRNEDLAGRSPLPVEKTGAAGVFEFPKLSKFSNQTAGIRAGGPIIKNKLFYFILAETQTGSTPQPFNFSEYRGAVTAFQLSELVELLRTKYQYDPGSYAEAKDVLNAHRLLARIDWNPSVKNKFSFSIRYNNANRLSLAAPSGSTLINFSNFSSRFPAESYSSTFEWKNFSSLGATNRLLVVMTNEQEDRRWQGKPFPRVIINDGPSSIVFGSSPTSTLSFYTGTNIAVSDIFKFTRNKYSVTTGLQFNYTTIHDAQINNFFGTYQYKNIDDFMSSAAPLRFQRSFSLLDTPAGDETLAEAAFQSYQAGAFINSDIHISTRLNMNFGIRLDKNFLPSHTYIDHFFNDTARQIISAYYNLEGAKAGIALKPQLHLSPRFGFIYKIPKHKMIIQGGGGIFSGRLLNISADVLYARNGVSIGSVDINPQTYGLNFNPDPYHQPSPASLGINPANTKGELDLISQNFKHPSVFKTSLMFSKKITSWTFAVESILTKNIHEAKYTNVNILPAVKTTNEPHPRNIYSTTANPQYIPLRANGTNSYTGQVFLMSNNHGKKGSSYCLSAIIDKQWPDDFSVKTSYSFGKSSVLFESSFNNSIYSTQWRFFESVNGKNNATLSPSDLSMGHRIMTTVMKTLNYKNKKTATTFSLFYNGQSGVPYSYVYNGSMINDDGNKQNFDLIFIPAEADLALMNFVPVSTTSGTLLYSAQQQRELLNDFIKSDRYLRRNRGKFAERNGARLPFTNIVDIRLQQDFKCRITGKKMQVSIHYDVFNFLNMINRNWGRMYYLAGESYPLIRFAGYINNTLTPQYQFIPVAGNIYSIQPATTPGNSARWISELGIKITLE